MIDPALQRFLPAVAGWFTETFGEPTPPQAQAWPLLLEGRDVVVSAPTGSGKTLAAFLAALDGLVRDAAAGALADEVRVVYVSPLKALSNDVGKNLLGPLAAICARLGLSTDGGSGIRVAVRTGDTPQKERAAAARKPPHVLVTTPESLFVLLGSAAGQRMLRTARTVILDEVHAVCGVRRGAHLALSVERLEALCVANGGTPLQRVGLSATQKPIAQVARFVAGAARAPCAVVDTGHRRALDVDIEVPSAPLEAVMSNEGFAEVVRRIAALVEQHTTTLVFVNTRRMAERLAARLDDELAVTLSRRADAVDEVVGRGRVCAHHGSMARDKRLAAEDRLKRGELRALVATSSLELGIDVGAVDLVCQVGVTRSIAGLLQRVGRAGHQKGLVPKGRIFPMTRDELVEACALTHALLTGDLDELTIPPGGIDVLAQHIVAAVAAATEKDGTGGLPRDAVRALVRRAFPYRKFDDHRINDVIRFVVDGVQTPNGRRGSWLYLDGATDTLRARRGARLAALTSGGAIPDLGEYTVVESPTDAVVGSVHEDFAVESMVGDVFQLGTTSWRVERVERGVLRVSNAAGQPPTVPFWFGEAPARTDALSRHTCVVRDFVEALCDRGADEQGVAAALRERFALSSSSARQLSQYLCAARAALGTLPTEERIVVERFEDAIGGTQIVIHAPFGSRVTRAWGLALRKRFCRTFDFELQAAATEDAILLSVGAIQGVDLTAVPCFVTSRTIESVLVQAVLAAPMFGTRFRWNAMRALTVLRNTNGRRVPPGLLRIQAEDVLVSLFPDAVACAENIQGDRGVPDHVLVRQTIDDCSREAMDVDGVVAVLRGIEDGRITVRCVERSEPSPLALEIVNARPYAFLDDVPLEERRVRAVMTRRALDGAASDEQAALDLDVVDEVLEEVRPRPETADEAWDLLRLAGFLRDDEMERVAGPQAARLVEELVASGRAARIVRGGASYVVAAEGRALFENHGEADVVFAALRGRLELHGPRTRAEHLRSLAGAVAEADVDRALDRLLREGLALAGRFDASKPEETTIWARRLVHRARRRMVDRLRREIEPVSAQDLMRFLLQWQHVGGTSASPGRDVRARGREGLRAALRRQDGVTAPAAAWEAEILPARVADYDRADLDALCLSGEVQWRCYPRAAPSSTAPSRRRGGLARQTAVTFLDPDTAAWLDVSRAADVTRDTLSSSAEAVRDALAARGPSFFRELQRATGQLPEQLERSLAEAIAAGVVSGDGFAAVRALVRPAKERERLRRLRTNPRVFGAGLDVAGRFALVTPPQPNVLDEEERAERCARLLLHRTGVVFRRLVERDPLMPPWHELLMAFRRLEARGEVRGGRFVTGFSGEQFALSDVVAALRAVRRTEPAGGDVVLSAADPLNLTGVVLPGERVPAVVGHRIILRAGLPVAVLDADGVRILDDSLTSSIGEVSTALRGRPRLFAGGAR